MREFWDAWRTDLRERLEDGEKVVAEGRARVTSDLRLPLDSTYDYVVVTDRRVMWIGNMAPSPGRDVRFSDATAIAEGTFGHRYVLALHHGPQSAGEWVPRRLPGSAHKHIHRRRTETRFGFSRRDTQAAVALRDATAHLPAATLPEPDPPSRPTLAFVLVVLVVRCALYWPRRLTGRGRPAVHRDARLKRSLTARTKYRRTPPGPGPSEE